LKPTTNPLRGFFALIVLSAVFLFSCNKEPDLLGLDLLPPGDRLNGTIMDTATIAAYSVFEDSIFTGGMTYGVIGSIYDDVFGKTTASLYTQIRMTSNAPTFGTGAVVDSVVLVLPYYGLFGDSSAIQTFRIYELSGSLDADKKYYSNNAEIDKLSLLAEKTFLPRVSDSVNIDTVSNIKIIPQLRIKFGPQFAEKIMSATANDLLNNDNFVQYFKGIVITTDPKDTPGGSLVSFNLTSTTSRLKMYYHNSTDALVYDFSMEASARFNRYDHNHYNEASQELKDQVLNSDTIAAAMHGKQKLYIQAFGGTKVKLRFPYLKKWAAGKKIAINNALLIMNNADLSGSFNAPASLSLREKLTDSTQSILIDEAEGSSYFGGTYNDSKGYQFRISRYIQQLLIPATEDKGLYLLVPGASYIGNRLILNGTDATMPGRMKLVITYTKIN
jgi:hypothetical protein